MPYLSVSDDDHKHNSQELVSLGNASYLENACVVGFLAFVENVRIL